MTTFSIYSFRFLKISPYKKKFFFMILAPPSGRRPGQLPPPCPPPRYATSGNAWERRSHKRNFKRYIFIIATKLAFVHCYHVTAFRAS